MAKETLAQRLAVLAGLACACVLKAAEPVTSSQPAVAPTSIATTPAANNTDEINDTDWKFVTRLTAIATYDDNIFIQPHGAQHDTYFHFAPSLAFGIGTFREEIAPFAPIPHLLAFTGEEEMPHKDFIYASYTPDAVVFSKFHHENAVNHDVRLAARKERELWYVQGLLHFQNVDDIDIDVGHRLRQTYFTLDTNAWYALTGKTNVDLGFLGFRSEYSSGSSSTDFLGSTGLDYQIAPKTAVGVGAAIGYLDASNGGNQTYEQPLLQLRYNPSGKISLNARAGEEFRHFDSNIPHRSRFVYYGAANYEPSDDTTVTFSGERNTTSSAQYVGENIVADTVQGRIRERAFTRLFFTLGGGYVRDRYEENRITTPLARRDDYYFSKISASRDVTTHGTIELSYEHRENDSTVSTFGFSQNVASLAASFMY